MITYELLQKLEKGCLELLKATSGILGNDDRSLRLAHKKIVESVRKIEIANELMGRAVICVSGLQGTGKRAQTASHITGTTQEITMHN